ncbi:MAG: 3-oxo-tetronate 4-phosphate decarboxylase [Verrucomicrobiota bacterium]
MDENLLRQEMVAYCKSLFERGYSCGTSGNISVRCEDALLVTPTNSSFGSLDPDRISKISLDGKGTLLSGDKPSKEWVLHYGFYERRPECGAVVHLHSSFAVAVSCLQDINPANTIPPITPYFVMRVGDLPLAPYFPPGDIRLAEAVTELAANHSSVLMANHGPVVSAKNLKAAVGASEELEETAKTYLLIKDSKFVTLTSAQISELKKKYG